jgi:hypothetical protein
MLEEDFRRNLHTQTIPASASFRLQSLLFKAQQRNI